MTWKHESEVTRGICKGFERCNATVIPIVGSFMQLAGVPDRYIAHPKWKGFLEFKVGRNKLSPAQEVFIRKLHKAGVCVAVLHYNIDTKVITLYLPDSLGKSAQRIFEIFHSDVMMGGILRPETASKLLEALATFSEMERVEDVSSKVEVSE